MKSAREEGVRGCSEYASWTRRRFLKGAGAGAAAVASAPAWMPQVAYGAGGGTVRDTLVLVFLRGGLDGLSLCAPYGDPELYNRRPTLAIQPPGSSAGAVDLDGFFGLAPSAASLLTPFQSGQLAFVHACGSTDPSRSHFDAMKIMEAGVPNQPGSTLSSGWLGRHLATSTPSGGTLLRGLALEDMTPRALSGAPATLPLKDPAGFVLPGDAATTSLRRALISSMYAGEAAPLGAAALDTFATVDLLSSIDFAGYSPANGAVYPGHAFGQKLKIAAALIKADAGVEVVEADFDGWDLHASLGPVEGALAAKMDVLSKGLLALWRDLGAAIERVTVVVMSEFGRRAAENGSGGVDHGHGNCMLVMGGHVAGGQVLTQWPGLAPANLDQGDLAITIDYRDILAEILAQRLGSTSLGTVFPNHTPSFHGITV
jgi:uncharacterized protein (DUF1501 family)